MPPAFYDTLIEWELMDDIFDLLDERTHTEAYRVLTQILDYTVLETVLSNLHPDHHYDFMELCTHQHHEPSLLNWLEERNENIIEIIRVRLSETKSQVKISLLEL